MVTEPIAAMTSSDPEPAVRSEAAWALGEVATLQAKAALTNALSVETDAAAQQTTTAALARAQTLTGESQILEESFWASLAAGLTAIPASRWTMLAFSLVLGVLLLIIGRRQPRVRT